MYNYLKEMDKAGVKQVTNNTKVCERNWQGGCKSSNHLCKKYIYEIDKTGTKQVTINAQLFETNGQGGRKTS
jgi:hypothetical protein